MYTFILDIGKTNIKGQVIDESGGLAWSRSCANVVNDGGPYPHFDVEGIWYWLQSTLAEAAQAFAIHAINVTTHGACALLLDESGQPVLPALDYEHSAIARDTPDYDAVRPAYASTLSPNLGAGLNLGRQLWWLKKNFPEAFSSARWLLLYPQYWAYRLTGIAAAEVTSLGCHTDLWEPRAGRYSSLVSRLEIEDKLPPLVEATRSLGPVLPSVARELGLPVECRVYAGVHDSNAGFARYLAAGLREPFTVMSTGTWVVAMMSAGSLDVLQEQRDMLANVSVVGRPVACARFMGGREFERLCQITGADPNDPVSAVEVQRIVDDGVYACPPFVVGSGPFKESQSGGGVVTGAVASGASLATLYLALVMDYQLDLLEAHGNILFGGVAQKNPLLCRLLAQLRPHQPVLAGDDTASTIRGAWCLTRWQQPMPHCITDFAPVAPADVARLQEYRRQWRHRVVGEQEQRPRCELGLK